MTRTAQPQSGRHPSAGRTLGAPASRILGALVVCLLFAGSARGQVPAEGDDDVSPSEAAQAAADFELISALDRVVGRAISRAERSVVSIARRGRSQALAQDRQDTRPPFGPGGQSPLVTDDPRSPDFM